MSKQKKGPAKLDKSDVAAATESLTKPRKRKTAAVEPPADDFRAAMRDAVAAVEEAEREHEEAHEKALEKKHAVEAAINHMRKLAKEEGEPSLFNRPSSANGAASANGQAAGDEPWVSIPITEALEGVSINLIDKMQDAEIKTMGDYRNYCNKAQPEFGKHPLTTIKGIGEAKAVLIEEAAQAFWVREKEAAEQAARQQEGAKTDAEAFAEQEAAEPADQE